MTRSQLQERFAGGAKMLIGGRWLPSGDGATLPSIDPSTGAVITVLPEATETDVDDAADAARRALPEWRELSAAERAEPLGQLAERLDASADELALIDAVDSGTPLRVARDGVREACRAVRESVTRSARAEELPPEHRPGGSVEVAEPFGVVGRICDHRQPLRSAVERTVSALAAGNAVVLKPSEYAALSALRFAELAADLLPPGALNVLTGRGGVAGVAIAAHPGITRLDFSGRVATGRAVAGAGAEALKTISVDLVGNNPMVVLADADLDEAARAAVAGLSAAAPWGPSGRSISRVFVHADVREAFTSGVLDLVRALQVGDPAELETDLGPMVSREHLDRALRQVKAGKQEGATLLVGGHARDGPGWYMAPTVFGGVDPDMSIATGEKTGPVLSLITWTDVDRMLDEVNDVPLGRAAEIWTADPTAAARIARSVRVARIAVNPRAGQPLRAVESFDPVADGLWQGPEAGSFHWPKTVAADQTGAADRS